jgi:VIT1/CCC1 family predicted Fe2+/Mn2+ transporter
MYGASDGVVTTLAVIAGASGASFSRQVGIVMALANLVADGISMGASNYLGMRSELEQTGISIQLEKPWRHGLATFAAFMIAGSVPVLSFLAPLESGPWLFLLALALSLITLAAFGGARARFVKKPIWRAALEVVVVALAASIASYLVGWGAHWISVRLGG